MKNKKLISFCIHLLIGIIFSFPVITAESNAMFDCSSDLMIIEQGDNVSCDLFLGDVLLQYHSKAEYCISEKKFFSNNHTDGNSGSSTPDYLTAQFCNFYHCNSIQLVRNLNHTFVDLSYLKDLKTTKMLC